LRDNADQRHQRRATGVLQRHRGCLTLRRVTVGEDATSQGIQVLQPLFHRSRVTPEIVHDIGENRVIVCAGHAMRSAGRNHHAGEATQRPNFIGSQGGVLVSHGGLSRTGWQGAA
jgi:hypothetical protein